MRRTQGHAAAMSETSGLCWLLALAAACSNSQLAAPIPARQPEPAPSATAGGNRGGPSAAPTTRVTSAPDPQAPAAVPEAPAPGRESAPPACDDKVTSDLPGASIRLTTKACSYSQAKLGKGVVLGYEVVIEKALRQVRPRQWREEVVVPWPKWAASFERACYRPSDASNFTVAYWIADDGEYMPPVRSVADQRSPSQLRIWCPRCFPDGFCGSQTMAAADVAAGAYPQVTRRWTGSDELHKAPFPPGEYALTLRADGSYRPDGADEPRLFHMQTTRRITIVP